MFTNFAISFVKVCDPLLLHNGKVETVNKQPLPEYSETLSYLRLTRLPGFCFQVFLVALYAVTLFDTTSSEVTDADPELKSLLILMACICVIVLILVAPSKWLSQFAIFRTFKSARIQVYNYAKEKLSQAERKTKSMKQKPASHSMHPTDPSI